MTETVPFKKKKKECLQYKQRRAPGGDTQASVAAIQLNVWLRFDFDSLQQSVNSNQVSCIKCRFPHIAGIQPMQRGNACWVKSANKMEKKKKKMLTMLNTEKCLDFFFLSLPF